MAIKKQEYYEGAALHQLICYGGLKSISFKKPFFVLNETLYIYLKYSTQKRSPWGFTFVPNESRQIQLATEKHNVICGLVCGFDGIVTIDTNDLISIGLNNNTAIGVACYRKHGEYYRISGPACELEKIISPSEWVKILKKKTLISEES